MAIIREELDLDDTLSDIQILHRLEALFKEVDCSVTVERQPILLLRRHRIKNDEDRDATQGVDQMCYRAHRKIAYGSRAFRKITLGFHYPANRKAVILAVASYIHEAISRNEVMTKRDIFYRDVSLFGNQGIVDQTVSQLATHIGVQRHRLHIEAAAKGLLRGPMQIRHKDGRTTDCAVQDTLISEVHDYSSFVLNQCDFVLVIEKEAVFRSLTPFVDGINGGPRFIIITGKGYPDIATRKLLHFLHNGLRQSSNVLERTLPIVCLVDYDPHGVEILCTYRFGSAAMSESREHLAIPELKWLGIHHGDFLKDQNGVLDLSKTDNAKLDSMISRFSPPQHNVGQAWLHELTIMKSQQRKAEIEIMHDCKGGLGAYVIAKLDRGEWK